MTPLRCVWARVRVVLVTPNQKREETQTAMNEVRSDGRTVWVTNRRGFTVGRFSKFGIDVHTADASGCIDCTHTLPTMRDWHRFQNGMLDHHRIEVGGEHCPDWLA